MIAAHEEPSKSSGISTELRAGTVSDTATVTSCDRLSAGVGVAVGRELGRSVGRPVETEPIEGLGVTSA
jgi:hypothetical protein